MMRFLLSLVLCAAFSMDAQAQWSNKDVALGKATELPDGMENKTGGLINSINAAGLSGYELDLSQNENVATLQISGDIASDFNSGRTTAVSKSWELSLSTPLNETDDPADSATLDRLSSGTKASAKFTFGRTSDIMFRDKELNPSAFVEVYVSHLAKAKENCLAAKKLSPADITSCEVPKQGEGNELPDYIKKYFPDVPVEDFQLDAKHMWFTASADLGYDDYEFLEQTDLTSQTEQEYAYKAGVAFSYTETKSPFLFSVGANFESAFEQADEMENCIGEGDMENCVTGRLGAPERTDDWLAFTEVRRIANVNFGPVKQIGLAPRVTYNASKGLTGVNMPVYFIKPEGGLSSGFQVGWRSDTKDVTAGIIIGGTFDFLSD